MFKNSLALASFLVGSILFTGGFAAAGKIGTSTCISGNTSKAYSEYKYSCTTNIIVDCSAIYKGEYFVGFSNQEGAACSCVRARIKSFLSVQTNQALKKQCQDALIYTESTLRRK